MARNASAMSLHRKPSVARLLAGISGGAASLALASMPAPALGQAVNGTPTPQFGISGVSRSTPGLDSVFVTNSEALLDWTASDSGGVFLPEGNTLRFIYDGSTPYTVLNRVTDTAVGGPLSIAGTVESSSLGKVWFYNAGGWVVGPKGVFNVGSLVLTSLPITIDPASDTVSRLYGDKNEIRFGTALDPKSSVTIQSGAQINASLANSSYVAMVAPRVEQAGTVSVNGSAAYVAAEAATMTINSGLFDIIVDSGSDDTEGVVHTGTTRWPANASSTDANHRIYLVAVPKNQAMTAVVSGSMGYNGATTASVVDGSIVLSAGYNVAGGNVSADNAVGGNASLSIIGLTVGQKGARTDLNGHATRDVNIDATTSTTSVRGTVDLLARRNVSASIDNGNSLVADSGLSLGSMNGAKAGNVSVSVAGGGSLNVGGALDLYAIATGAIQTDPLNGDALLAGSVGEDAVSGNVGLTIRDGNFNLGSVNLTSMATSGVGEQSAGSATAGDVTIDIGQTDGAASTFGGSLGGVELYSYAANGAFSLQSPINGGNAVAGAATLTLNGGTFDSSSIAVASDAGTFAGVVALPLDATAGPVSISFANGNGSFSTGGITAANYATASDGGLVTLGDVSLAYDNVQSVTSDSFGSIGLQSYAYGNLIAPNTVSLTLTGSSNLETFGSVVSLQAEGRNDTTTQLAGNVSFVADASALNASELNLSSQAFASGSGIAAAGGNVSAVLRNGANATLGSAVSLQSRARGGSGPDGGSGTGGSVSFTNADSSFTVLDPSTGSLSLLSNGVAGQRTDAAGRSGTGLGGTVTFIQTGKPANVLANTVTLTSLGQGGRPDISARTGLVAQAGDGAAGVGGDVSFSVAEGTFSASSLTIGATGEGGNAENVAGFAPGTGGSGTGGTSTFSITGGLLTASTVDVTASGFGGDGAQSSDALGIVGGIGGAGTGGIATVNLSGGTLRTEGLTVEANGNKSQPDGSGVSYFGNGGYDFFGTGAAGDGGLGIGGSALLTIDGGTLGEIPFSSAGLPVAVTVNAIGEGGAGGFTFGSSGAGNQSGAGGNGQGGTAGVRFLSGTFDAQTVGIDATGLGGLGGNDANSTGEFALNAGKGGDGAGGTSTLELASNFGVATTSGSTRDLEVRADGIGQAGESGLIGGEGGSGLGGTARILVNGGSSSFADPVLSAEGLGKAGGNSTDGYGGGAGGSGTGGQAVIAVTGDGTNLSIAGASLRVSGLGGAGGRGGAGSDAVDEAGDGGAGGAGTGGAISLVASDLGQLNSTGTEGSLFASNGIGGAGGLGGNSAFNGWRTLGDGGDGGSGRGGTVDALAQGGGVITFDALTLGANGQGGVGGSYAILDVSGTFDQSVGGAGGAGFGGSISVQAVGLNSRVEAPSLLASASGRGGAGVNGFGYAADGSSADGSAGGSGTGGSVSVLADAGGAVALATADGNIGLSANGIGGNGGSAIAAITADSGIGGNGGNGGDSGSGIGGTLVISAIDEGTASLGLLGTVTLSANGTGGIAGLGGDGANSTALVTLGGNGGNNGLAEAGRGGTVTVGATGGVATFGTLLANATGETFDRPFAGAGGSGTSGSGLAGSSAFVTPLGGQVFFSSADGNLSSTGSLVAGATTVDVTSKRTFPASSGAFINELGGTISLTSSSTAPVDAMRFASFSGDASGAFAGFSDPAISLMAVSGPIAIDGDLNLLAAGSISLSVADGLNITAGGSAYLGSDTGLDIAAAGTGQFSGNSIELQSRGGIGIAVTGCATATCRPIEATTSLLADASGDFTISGPAIVAGLGSLDVYAFGNVTGGAASGYFSGGSLRVRAGQDATIRNATGASLDLEAGAIPDGATLYFDGLLTLGEASGGGVFNATGDIVFASGGGIAVTGGNSFSAGTGIDVRSGNDIIVGRNNSFVANTSAAVPGLPVTFAAGGLTLQYSLAPEDIAVLAFGSGSTVSAGTGAIALSGAAIDARLATFTGASFRADVLQTLGLTSPRRNNGERLDPDCLEGAICIGNIDVSGTVRIGNTDAVPLDIRAVGTISGSDVRLLATGNVTLQGVGRVSQITSTGNLSIRSILGDVVLLDGAVVEGGTVRLAAGANISGTGNVTATVDDIGFFAGGDIDAASLTAARELTTDLAAGGLAEGAFSTLGALRVGALTLGASTDITTGTSLEIGELALGGFNGSLSAGTVLDLGSTTAVNDLSLSAGTSVGFTSLAVDGNLVISAPSITGTSAQSGGTLSITGDGLTADLLQSAGDLTLSVTDTAALGTVNSTGGSVTIDPALLTFDAITSASGMTLSGGTITGGTLDAGTSIEVTATGALTLASANAGTTMSLGADSLQSGALDAGDSLTLTIANGATLTGAATAGGDLVANFGTLDFTTLGTTGLVSLEGTDLTGSSITAGTSLTALLAGNYAVTDAQSGTSLALQSATATATTLSAGVNLDATVTGLADLADVSALGDLTLSAGSLLSGSITAGGLVDIGVSGTATVGATTSGTTLTFDAGNLNADSLDAGTVLSLTAANAATITGTASAGTNASVSAASLTGGSFTATGNLGITTTGNAAFADASAGGALTLSGADVSFTSVTGKTVGITATNMLGNSIALTDALSINATGDITLALIGPTAGTVDITGASLSLDLVNAGDLGIAISGDAVLGSVLGSGKVTLSAANLQVDSLGAAGVVSLSGTTIGAGTILADSDLGISATGTVTLDRAEAGGTLAITAAGLGANTLQSAGDLTLTVTNTAALGTVTSTGGSVLIDPALLTFDAITSASGITLSGGTITGGTLDAGGAVDVNATGALTLTSARSGTTMSLIADSLQAGGLDAGTDLSLAVAGGINLTDIANAGGALIASFSTFDFADLDAGGLLDLSGTDLAGTSIVAGGNVSISMTGDYAVSSLTGSGNLLLGAQTASGNLIDVIGNADVTVVGLSSLLQYVAGGNLSLTAGVLSAQSLGGANVDANIAGAATLVSGDAGANFALAAGSLDAGALRAGGDLSLTATGLIGITGDASAGGNLSITSADLVANTLTADGGIGISATNGASLVSAVAGQLLTVTATDLSFSSLSAADIQITAGSVSGGGISADDSLTVSSTGLVDLDSALAGGALTITSRSLAVPTVQSRAGNVSLAITGLATIGDVSALAGDVSATAARLNFGSASASGQVQLGGVAIGGGVINAGTSVVVSAVNSMILDTVTAGSSVGLRGGNIDVNAVNASTFVDYSGRDIRVGTTDAGTTAAVVARSFTFDSLAANESVGIRTSLGVAGGTIDAGTTLDIDAGGAVTLDRAQAGGSIRARFATLGFNLLDSGGLLDLAGTDLAGTGMVAGGGAAIALTGNYGVGSITGSGDLTLNALSASSSLIDMGGNVALSIVDTAALGTVTSRTGSVTIDPALLTFDAITSASGIILSGGVITGGTLDAGTSIEVTATGALTLASANAGTTMALGADSLQSGALDAGDSLTLTIANGATLTGAATAGGDLVASFGTLDFTTLGATGLASLEGTDLSGSTITAGTSLTALLAGNYAVTDAQSGTSLALQSATAAATTLSAGANLDATVTSLADLADVSALGDLTLSAGSLLSGSITAGGLVDIGVSGTATVGATTSGTTLTFDAGTLNADSLDAGTVLSLTAANAATITGTASAGTDATVSAASLTGGSFTAAGNLGITTTGNAAFADASAGGALTLSGADVSFTSVTGKTVGITATNMLGNSIALTDALSINATGDITLALIGPTAGTVDITGASLSLDLVNAGDLGIAISGDALIGSVLGSGKVTLSAANLQVDSLGAAGVVSLSGTTIGAGTILADSDLGISATGNVTLDRAEAGGTLAITAAGLGVNTLQSAGDLTLTVANTAALGTVTSTGGSVFIDPALLTFDAITSASGITLSGGTITGGTLDAGGAVDVNATGALTLDLADAGTTLSLIGASIQAGSLRSGGTSSVAAQDRVSITNAITSGGDVLISAAGLFTPLLESNSGNVTLAISGLADLSNVAASGGDLLINAGTLRFASASALRAVRLSGADIAGTTVTSGTPTSISASLIANVGTVTAGSSATINGQDLTVSKVTAGTFTDFDGRIINVGETTAGTTAFVDAGDFTFDKLTAGESVEILSAGDTAGGSLIAGTTLSIQARGDAQFDDAQAGGAITIGAANLNALTVTGDAGLSLVVTNAIDLDTVKVLGSFDLSGASLNLGSSSSGLDSTFSLTGNATIGSVAAGLATTGQNLVQIVVQALANSYTGGTLTPVFDVVQGQTITVSSSTNDLWSAGALPRISDGDGLVVFRVATAQDDSGFQPGTQIGAAFGNLTIGNFSAPFGALVGQIGNETVLLGANGTVTAPATGTLSVGYWDSNAGDNSGSIAFTFGTGGGGSSVSSPANVSITTGGNLTVASAAASSAITLDAAGALKLDTADAGTTLSLTGNTIDAGTLKAGTNIAIASTGTSLIGNASAGGSFSANVGALDFTLIDADGAVDIRSLTGTRGGNITSGANITIDEDGAITLGNATATGTVDLAADGSLTYGKLDGGSVAVSAASASGGAITARTGSLALTATGDLSTGALDAHGAITLSARDAMLASARSDDDIGANVRLLTSPNISAAGNFIVTGTGKVEVGTASAGDALSVTSQTLTFTRMTAGNALSIATSGNIAGGDLIATGQMRINSGNGNFTYGTLDSGDIAFVGGSIAGGALQARTGAVNIAVARTAAVGAITAAANVGIDARTLAFTTINAGGAFGTNNGTMTGTSISAGQDISISSQGDVSLSGLSGRVARVRSNGVVNITGIELTGPISVSADAVGLDATGNLAIRRIFAERGNVDVTAGGSIDADTILALGDIDLLARNGDVTVGDLSAGYSDVFSDAVRPQGQVSGAVGQGNIDIVASDNIVINDVADAAQVFTMTAGDTIRINGLATGAQMNLSSADLAIGDSGRLGETAHTSAITLRNTGQGVTRLGDNIPSTTSGYAISQAEFARIRSRGDLTIRGIRPMLVGDLTVVAQAGTVQGQIGETGTLSLRSTGLISFLGALSMSNAAGNTLSVSSSADGIFLDAQTGSIRLLEGETRGGSLLLSGSGIAMVTRTALEDIAQLTDTALITDRLGLNDGVTDGRTLVEADAITLRSDEQVYIQNTSIGTRLDDRRGLVANSLRIGSREGGVLDIVINGIVNGQTGVDAIEQITFEEAFTDLSSVNGCVILSANTCNKLPFEIIELRDLIEEVLENDPADNALQVLDSFAKTSLIQLNQIAPAGFEPLIDEPVTGTGNDDLLGEGKQDGE